LSRFKYLVYVQLSYEGDKTPQQALEEAEESIKSFGKAKMLSDYSNLIASLDKMLENKSVFPPIPTPAGIKGIIHSIQSLSEIEKGGMHGDFKKSKADQLEKAKAQLEEIAKVLGKIENPPKLLPSKDASAEFTPEIDAEIVSVILPGTENPAAYYEDFDFYSNRHIIHAFYTIEHKEKTADTDSAKVKMVANTNSPPLKRRTKRPSSLSKRLTRPTSTGFPSPHI